MVGLITLLDSILLSISGSYRAAGQVILSENWVQLSLLTFQTLNKICLLNTKMVQNWLASRNQITELFHLVLFWMQYFSTQQYPKALYPIIDELVVLVGYVCFFKVWLIDFLGYPRTCSKYTNGLCWTART